MRILMLGAGGIGGYFGARIHDAGGDITFLVRPDRADKLWTNGLHVLSPLGNLHITPNLITHAADNAGGGFDIVVLACKAYDLNAAIEAVSPALAAKSIVIPLLNGVAHLDPLDVAFGRERVFGGLAHLGVTLTPEGEIKHLNTLHHLVVGPRTTLLPPQLTPLTALLASSGIDFALSEEIERDMWGKFVFLATLAAATCTMRACIGDILQTHRGEAFIVGLLDECTAIAHACGQALSPERLILYRQQLTARDSTSTASLLRDIERQGQTEAEHILGDMVRRANRQGVAAPLLGIAYSHLQAYEIRRQRTSTQAQMR